MESLALNKENRLLDVNKIIKLTLHDPDSTDTDFFNSNNKIIKINNFKNENLEFFSKQGYNELKETTNTLEKNLNSRTNSNNLITNNKKIRRDFSGKIIEKSNKKNYHITFKDKIGKNKLIDYVNIKKIKTENDQNTLILNSNKENIEIKKDQQSCVCLIY